uniref:ParE toxin of type II toxin-antitoxin system, parDE n=1 Tax=Candidatus Kentrum sp. DK TaxID=2126562 RepID=A0A450SJ85_9GAMM|nr:MAG: hypothetical protein BECKDK2373B_GA0170837_104234 [Candidatus Kentron sp. DK]
MRLRFHPEVSHEVKASYAWYQKQAEGLGEDFMNELQSAYEAIAAFPQAGSRRTEMAFDGLFCQGFPFRLLRPQKVKKNILAIF